MAEEGDDKESRTEDPSDKRLEEARKKGQVPSSREVGTALLLLAALLLFAMQGQALWLALQGQMRFFLGGGLRDDMTPTGVIFLIREVVADTLLALAPFFGLFLILGVLASLIQHGWLFSVEALQPKFAKINPLEGFKRLFSFRSLVELFKSILKMTVIAFAVYLGIKDNTVAILGLADTSVPEVVNVLADDSMSILWRVTIVFVVLAILDYVYQRHEYMKNLRMSRQELKDEYKQTEGDPMIKARVRQVQREMARRRMMAEVPKADVVITNPTHYAVALRYTPGEMKAPMVVAKGTGHMALRIRELARESGVPLVENPPLARTLYSDVKLEQMIPPNLFKAVAEVMAYVYRLRGRRSGSERPVEHVRH